MPRRAYYGPAALAVSGRILLRNEAARTSTIGWGWGRLEDAVARRNVVVRNLVETSCKFLGDGAGIYLLGHQPGSVVSGNVVDGVGKGHGFYLDDGSKNVTLSGNVGRDAALAPHRTLAEHL